MNELLGILLFLVLPSGAMIWGAIEASKRHSDKLLRREMYNEVMAQWRMESELDMAMCGNDMAKLNAWYLDADGKRAARREEILRDYKRAYGIN